MQVLWCVNWEGRNVLQSLARSSDHVACVLSTHDWCCATRAAGEGLSSDPCCQTRISRWRMDA